MKPKPKIETETTLKSKPKPKNETVTYVEVLAHESLHCWNVLKSFQRPHNPQILGLLSGCRQNSGQSCPVGRCLLAQLSHTCLHCIRCFISITILVVSLVDELLQHFLQATDECRQVLALLGSRLIRRHERQVTLARASRFSFKGFSSVSKVSVSEVSVSRVSVSTVLCRVSQWDGTRMAGYGDWPSQ